MAEVKRIASRAWEFLDEGQNSYYLVVGDRAAAVIDTGITVGGDILPQIKKITDLPLVLVLTHAHIDHMHHMDAFSTVYMCHGERQLPAEFLREMMAGKKLDLWGTVDIRTGSRIDLGGMRLEICQVAGHTPGSVAVWNPEEDLLFTGDAIGSGCGVWMQVPGALPLDRYSENLRSFLQWLLDRGGRMRFFGGHNRQVNQSAQVPGYNPLSLGLLVDLIDLTEALCAGRITGTPCEMKAFGEEKPLYAAYGRAEIIYLASRLHG